MKHLCLIPILFLCALSSYANDKHKTWHHCEANGQKGQLMEVLAKAAHANNNMLPSIEAHCTAKNSHDTMTIIAKNIKLSHCDRDNECALSIDSLTENHIYIAKIKIKKD